MSRRGGTRRSSTTWITAIVLVCAGGLAWNLLSASPGELARRRFGDLVRAIDERRWSAASEHFDPAFDAQRIEGAWPRAARSALRRFSPDEASLRTLLEPLSLRLRLRSARADESADGSVTVSAVVQVRDLASASGMTPSPVAEEIRRRRPEVHLTTSWRELDGAMRLVAIDLAEFELALPRAQ
jgi:hypothetical protein